MEQATQRKAQEEPRSAEETLVKLLKTVFKLHSLVHLAHHLHEKTTGNTKRFRETMHSLLMDRFA